MFDRLPISVLLYIMRHLLRRAPSDLDSNVSQKGGRLTSYTVATASHTTT
jgi:hypothetical protein